MVTLKVVVSITQKEFEALSFFRAEVSDNAETATCEKYVASLEQNGKSYNDLIDRLFASKSKRIQILEKELQAVEDFRDETATKAEATSNLEYLADFNYHDKRFSNLKKKYYKAKSKATVKWALEQAKKRGLL